MEAVARVQEFFPERFGAGSESSLPLCRFSGGAPVQREHISGLLEKAAAAEGYSPSWFGTHSLRIGGATALLHAGMPIELIQRYGRWLSSAFQFYLWEATENSRYLAQAMAADQSTLAVARGRPKD